MDVAFLLSLKLPVDDACNNPCAFFINSILQGELSSRFPRGETIRQSRLRVTEICTSYGIIDTNSEASSSGENIQEFTKTRTTRMHRGKMYTVIIHVDYCSLPADSKVVPLSLENRRLIAGEITMIRAGLEASYMPKTV